MDTTSQGTAGQQNPRRNLDFSSLRVKRSNKSWEEHQRGAWSSSSARDFSRSETSGKEEADAAVARLHSSEACTTRAGTNPRLHSSEACTTRAGTNPRLHSSEACTTQAGTNPRLHSSKACTTQAGTNPRLHSSEACTTQAGTNPRLHSSEACTTQAGTNPRLHSSEACTTQAGTNPRLHSSKACTTQAGEPPKSSVISDCGGTVPREDGGGRPKALKRLSAMWSSFRKGKIDRVKEQDPVEARPILEEKASRQPRFVSGQYFFEYLVVVSLKKNKDGSNYEPQITYQFPKRDGMGRSQKEEEERTLKAITLFCFPEGIKWAPLTEYHSETFSFVLTELDGSRRNGYCRRLLPGGRGARPPEAYCIISSLACFGLFSEIFDEVEKRRQISMAMIYPFMQKLREAPFPAPGNTVEIKSFIPESGTEIIRLTRPLDSWLEHVDFPVLFSCLTDEEVLLVFAAAVLERRIIFIADDLGTLSQVIHAVAALLYPFTWQHTLISIVPSILIDVVMAPTPYLLGVQKRLLDQVTEQNDMLLVDLSQDKEETFIVSVGDEPSILPPKLQSEILEALIERKKASSTEDVNRVVSEAFLLFFVKTVGHYTSYVKRGVFEKRSFYKAIESKTTRHFVKKFIQTQMFDLFIQEVEQQDTGPQQGIFHKKIVEYQKMKKAKTKKH